MAYRSRILQIGGVILGLLAISAMAAPPIFGDHSRVHGNEVIADSCVDAFPGLERCAYVHAWEHYDVEGTFQFTGIWMEYRFYRSYPDGSARNGFTSMFCQTGRETIKANLNHMSLEAVLHPDGPECDSWGVIENCDPWRNCAPESWPFSDPTVVAGEWIDPINTSRSVVNRKDHLFDPVSETSYKIVTHCKALGGDAMSLGGLSIDFAGRFRYFPFDGLDTPGLTRYWLRSCNGDDDDENDDDE